MRRKVWNCSMSSLWTSDTTMVCFGVCVGVHATKVIMEQIEQQLCHCDASRMTRNMSMLQFLFCCVGWPSTTVNKPWNLFGTKVCPSYTHWHFGRLLEECGMLIKPQRSWLTRTYLLILSAWVYVFTWVDMSFLAQRTFTSCLHPRGCVDSVTKEAVSRHL